MDEARKHILLEGIEKLNGRLRQLKDIQLSAQTELNYLPRTDKYDDLRDYLSEAIDNLDDVIVEIYFLIKGMEVTLSTTIPNSPTKEEFIKRPESRSMDTRVTHQEEQPVRLKFLHKLILSILADRSMQAESKNHEERRQEGERRWNDTLNWQDAVLRGDSSDIDVDSSDW